MSAISPTLAVVSPEDQRCGCHHRQTRERCYLVRGHDGPHLVRSWDSRLIRWANTRRKAPAAAIPW